jgi:acylphosphatase
VSNRARLEAVVHGRVQGVGFRYHVLRFATPLGLDGWVANEATGRVRVVAEGPREVLERLLETLRDGPPGAFVEHVDEAWSSPTGTLEPFSVRSGSHSGD